MLEPLVDQLLARAHDCHKALIPPHVTAFLDPLSLWAYLSSFVSYDIVLPIIIAGLLLFCTLLVSIHRRDRRIAKVLAENIIRIQSLISDLPGVAYRCRNDEAWTMIFISEEIKRLTGYPPSDFLNNAVRRFIDVIHPDDRKTVAATIRQGIAEKRPFEMIFRLCHVESRIAWVQAKGHGIFDAHGRLEWIDGILMDVTRRQQAETERERLTIAIEQADEAIVITDAVGTILYVNPAFERITGYQRNEAVGANPRFLKSGLHAQSFYDEMWQTLSAGKVWQNRFINKRKDGSLYTEAANISPVRDANGDIINYVAVKRDITREIEAEEQQQQERKIESIGRLAGGVAHDFNNMLQAIFGHTEIAMELTEPSHPTYENLQAIRDAAQRASDLTRQLLAFARKQTIAPQLLDLNITVSNILKTIQEMLDEGIELIWRPAPDLGLVEMDPVQVDQILLNLCMNARDAITTGTGHIILTAKNVTLTVADLIQYKDLAIGDYIKLTVHDDGCGMDAKTLSHLFEPFFTTKAMGRGIGLGLATIYGIIQQNRGTITVASDPGRGTTFTIYLPRQFVKEEAQAVSATPSHRQPAKLAGDGETILLVEDEPAALRVAHIMLQKFGYRVLAAASPEDAIRQAEAHTGRIDLLLTDVVMPGMDGWHLSRRLLELKPEMVCLFMSGYTADIIARHGVIEKGLHFIQKPFTAATLAAKVKSVLNQHKGNVS